jgi:hypothetical protein
MQADAMQRQAIDSNRLRLTVTQRWQIQRAILYSGRICITDHIIPLEEAMLAISILNILQYGNVG